MVKARTLAELLQLRADQAKARAWDLRFLYAQGNVPQGFQTRDTESALDLRYADVVTLARRGAATLQRHGVEKGDRVLLLLPTGATFVSAFFGCQWLGAVPVPLVPPWGSRRNEEHSARIERVMRVCSARVAVLEASSAGALDLSGLAHVHGVELREEREVAGDSPASVPEIPAFIQFTSGSTADPKGVVVEHEALFANLRFILGTHDATPDDLSCSWLPLFHDMGLIGHLLAPIYVGGRAVLMPPEAFIRQPRVWLESISRERATFASAPNFAYDVCATKVAERDMASLDLSRWRVAMCGGEPVRSETIERFSTRFAKVGFKKSSFFPVYGLAEATLAVTIPPRREAPRVERVERARLEEAGEAVASAEETAVEVFSVGRAGSEHEIRIAGEDGEALPERRVGRIEFRGPSVMLRYFEDAEATRRALSDGWLRTGDLGYLADGELFVTGRSKELIIKGGRNLYPYDVEAAAARAKGVRKGRSAAFGVANAATGTEDLVLVCETRLADPKLREELEKEVIACVFAATGVRPDVVRIVAPDNIKKTSSGKIQRERVRTLYLDGKLDADFSWKARLTRAARRWLMLLAVTARRS